MAGQSTRSRALGYLLAASMLTSVSGIAQAAPPPNPNAKIPDGSSPTAVRRPNVLIIVADDLGFADVGFNGATSPTPNIDRIASTGTRLDRFYVAAVCSPSRAGLLTGRYPHRYGIMGDTITPGSDFGLDPREETIADALATAGYARRSFIGKWHLGHRSAAFHPMNFGFTSFYGHYNGAIDYFTHEREGVVDWHRDRSPSADQGYATDLMTEEAVRIINAPSPGGAPWMMWLAYNAPHGPLQATDEDLRAVGFDPTKPRFGGAGGAGDEGREGPGYGQSHHGNTRRQTYQAMVHGMDRGIGRILAALRATGQLDNTLILFTSDNGGPGRRGPNGGPVQADNGSLRGTKFQHFEGGVRVAAAISWPAALKPRAQAGVGPISYVDVLPTLAGITGARLGRPVDGQDVSARLLAGGPPAARKLFMGEDYRVPPKYGERGPSDPQSLAGRAPSVIDGGWKLVGGMLFDLNADPNESRDLAAQHPDLVARLSAEAAKFGALRQVPRDRLNATQLPPLPLWESPSVRK